MGHARGRGPGARPSATPGRPGRPPRRSGPGTRSRAADGARVRARSGAARGAPSSRRARAAASGRLRGERKRRRGPGRSRAGPRQPRAAGGAREAAGASRGGPLPHLHHGSGGCAQLGTAAGSGPLAHGRGPAPHGAGHGQPAVAAPFRARARAQLQRLRRVRRAAHPPGAARLAGGGADRSRLEPEVHAPADHGVERLPNVGARCRARALPGPLQRPLLALRPAPADG